jgi:uncharacterized membrane protein YeaQ/YmgE (transglycosylase-associated protein family)
MAEFVKDLIAQLAPHQSRRTTPASCCQPSHPKHSRCPEISNRVWAPAAGDFHTLGETAEEPVMSLEHFIAALAVGIVLGVLANVLIKRGNFGIVGDVLVSVCGALVIAFMLPTIGISLGGGVIGIIILAVIGATLALWAIRKARTA